MSDRFEGNTTPPDALMFFGARRFALFASLSMIHFAGMQKADERICMAAITGFPIESIFNH